MAVLTSNVSVPFVVAMRIGTGLGGEHAATLAPRAGVTAPCDFLVATCIGTKLGGEYAATLAPRAGVAAPRDFARSVRRNLGVRLDVWRRGLISLRGLDYREQFDSYMTMFVSHGGPGELAPGQFDRIAKALADPRRFALLEAIGLEEECPNRQLCQDFPVSKATISHHLKELVQAGLVESERDGQCVNLRARADVINAYTAELLRRVGGTEVAGG